MQGFTFHTYYDNNYIYYKLKIMNRRNWSLQEDQALKNAVEIIGNEDWTKISGLLRESCKTANEAKRTGKQCRQRWYNHLDPAISKEAWTEEQEVRLFEIHKTHGNKWKEISKYLPGRTDNDIKNRFYSTLRRSLRRLNKYIGEKNSTTHMREIRPSVLTIIINFIYENENNQNDEMLKPLRELPELVFKFASFKPVKNNMREKMNDQTKQKINIILGLVEQFNELYGDQKANMKGQKTSIKYNEQIKNESVSQDAEEDVMGIPLSDNARTRTKQYVPIIIRKKSSTYDRKKNQHSQLKAEDEVKLEEDFGDYDPMMHPFDENPHESFMSFEEPSVSANQNIIDLVVVGKHIQPVQYEVAQEEGVFQPTNIDEILFEHHEDK